MKKLLLSLVGLVVIVAVIGVLLPQDYEVSVSRDYPAATPAQLHAIVGDLKTWPQWGPWMEDDPQMNITHSTPSTGVGATQTWESANGNGRLLFTRVSPATGIEYDLFIEDFPKCEVSFAYQPTDAGTRLVWTMKGSVPIPVMGGYLALMFNSMLNNDFERGLANIAKLLPPVSRG